MNDSTADCDRGLDMFAADNKIIEGRQGDQSNRRNAEHNRSYTATNCSCVNVNLQNRPVEQAGKRISAVDSGDTSATVVDTKTHCSSLERKAPMVEVTRQADRAPHEGKISDIDHIVDEIRATDRIFQSVEHLSPIIPALATLPHPTSSPSEMLKAERPCLFLQIRRRPLRQLAEVNAAY